MKLKPFNREKQLKKICKNNIRQGMILSTIVMIMLPIIIYQSHALFKRNDNHNIIDSYVGGWKNLIEKIYVDNKEMDSYPANEGTKEFINIECTNSGYGTWSNTEWKATFNVPNYGDTICSIYFKTVLYLKNIILTAAGGTVAISSKGAPNFANAATTDVGMFATVDEYGTSYYFRGAVVNNNLIFAGFQWKIIRINGDGSVRLIYNGLCPNNSCTINTTGDATQISSAKYNGGKSDNRYVGYMYGTSATTYALTHANTTNSNAKAQLDNWYQNNILNLGTTITSKIADNIFCNDRQPSTVSTSIDGGGGAGTTKTFYGAYIRLSTNKNPSLKCTQQNDSFTVSDTTKGNGALTYPVGLITADEIVFAGGVYLGDNSTYFLYTGQHYWTMSPNHLSGASESSMIFMYPTNVNATLTNSSSGLRPIINLSSNVQITGGNGTASTPYIVN